MLLSTLIAGLETRPSEFDDQDIRGLTSDSRTVEPGYLFFALAGSKADGARFIDDAVKRGAAAVVAGDGAATRSDAGVPIIEAADPRLTLALVAARFFAKQPDNIVAVTGTSGKTSVADFARQLMTALGCSAASIGTIGVVKPSGAVYGSLTTPDPISLHKTLDGLAGEGVTHLAMEASSHGLDQRRLDGVRLKAAAFTNLGRDHLDYHPSVEAYLAAKLRLFDELLPADGTVVVNRDEPASKSVLDVAQRRGLKVIDVGRAGEVLKLIDVTRQGFHQRLDLECARHLFSVFLPLIGDYQVANALVATGLLMALGFSAPQVLPHLETLQGVTGRLEIAGEANGGLIVVDYAHKPEALAAALQGCRPFATGKLIAVFGCGGDRDKGKRPLMGKIAKEAADVVIVTDDNPRSEDPALIRRDIIAGSAGLQEIGDRREAIRAAISMMGEGDVVVVAGKGHETGQIIGEDVVPFSDHEEIAAALKAL